MGCCAAEVHEVDEKIEISAILVVILDLIENFV